MSKIKCLTSFYTVESFNCPGDIVNTSTDPVQLLWSPCNSASDLISVLKIFTRQEDEHCSLIPILISCISFLTDVCFMLLAESKSIILKIS